MKKRLKVTLATMALCLSMSTSVFADTLVVNIDGVDRVFTNVNENDGVVVVNALELSKKLELEYKFDTFKNTISFKDDENVLELKVNSRNGKLNSESVLLPTPPTVDENGNLYVPLEFVANSFNAEIDEKIGETDSVDLTFDTPYFSDINELSEVNETTKVYTYKEALKLANENSIAAQQTKLSYDELSSKLNDVNNYINMSLIYEQTEGIPLSEDVYIKALNTRYELIVAMSSQDERMELVETGVELKLMSALNNLTTAKINYYLAKENLEMQSQDLEFLKVKNSLGLVSDYTVDKSIAGIESSKASLKNLESAIETAKKDVNSILRLPLDEDVFIEYDIEIKPKEYKLDQLVSDAVYYSYKVEEARNALNDAAKEYESSNASYKIAKLALEQAEEEVEKSVNATYSSLESIIENDKLLTYNREVAVNDYNMALVQYELGYITSYDLDKLLLNIANIDSMILSNKMTYRVITFQLENPELF